MSQSHPAQIGTLVFHIGDPKTGTTAIQSSLFDGANLTPGFRIAYPPMLNSNVMAKVMGPKGDPRKRVQEWTAARDWLGDQTADVAVFSGEHFAGQPPALLRKTIAEYFPEYTDRLSIVCYVRPHLGRILSTYLQKAKIRGTDLTFERFLDNNMSAPSLSYAPRFRNWRKQFGEAFHLRAMIRDTLFKGDVVADFLKTGLGAAEIQTGEISRENKSPTLDQIALILAIHAALEAKGVEGPGRTIIGRQLAHEVTTHGISRGPKLRLPAARLASLQDTFRPDARALDTEFFDGTPMEDALTPKDSDVTSDPQSTDAGDWLTSAQLAEIDSMTTDLAQRIKRNASDWRVYQWHLSGKVPNPDLEVTQELQAIHDLIRALSTVQNSAP